MMVPPSSLRSRPPEGEALRPWGGPAGEAGPRLSSARVALTVGPVLYHRPRRALMDFYGGVADSAADTVVLGDTVCARRRELKPDDWLALARDLAAAGKEVVPDRDKKGWDLVKAAIDNGWSVSFPKWKQFIKDAAHASEIYGRLLTTHSIISSEISGKEKIELNWKIAQNERERKH